MPASRSIYLLFVFVMAIASPSAFAQTHGAQVQAAVRTFLESHAKALPGTASIEVGRVVENPRMEQCQQWAAFLPQGARVWGRVSVGVRCAAGTQLSLFVPATVKLHGEYVVAARPILGGQAMSANDLKTVVGELTAQPADVLTSLEQAYGQTARQALSPNQTVRSMHLKTEQAVQAGQTVKVISKGSSFAVANEGRAISAASRGQVARVRLANNQVVSGIATDAGIVEIVAQ